MPSIFISHNSKDKPFVRRLSHQLSKSGLNVWLDEAQLKVGDSLINKISKAINKVEFVVVVLSKNSIESKWVKKEISLSLTKEIKDSNSLLLPIKIDNCDIPFELSDKYYVDFSDPDEFDFQCEKLMHAMGMTIDWQDDGPHIFGNNVVIAG